MIFQLRIFSAILAILLGASFVKAQTGVPAGQIFIDKMMESFNQAKKDPFHNPIHDFKVQVVEQISNERHSELKIEVDPKGVVVQFNIDKIALENPSLALTNFVMLNLIIRKANPYLSGSQLSNLSQLMSHIEVLKNAQAGSPVAQEYVARLELVNLNNLYLASDMPQFDLFKSQLEIEKQKAADKATAMHEIAKKYIVAQQKKIDRWREETQVLEKYESMDEKLNDLILNNDRKGVADMLRAYLPWAVMEPVEAKTWQLWIEAIEKPNKSKTTIAFRGIDYATDKVQRKKTATGESIGLMSTVLTKNQGSYTRRLRSLSVNRLKNGSADGSPNIRMTTQILRHTSDPVASNFLSFSYSPGEAAQFSGRDKPNGESGGGFIAVKVDSRRFRPNLFTIGGEAELLVPLIIFPDEVLKYREGKFHADTDLEEFEKFVKDVSKIAKIDFIDVNGYSLQNTLVNEKQTLRDVFNEDGYRFFSEIFPKSLPANSCSKVML